MQYAKLYRKARAPKVTAYSYSASQRSRMRLWPQNQVVHADKERDKTEAADVLDHGSCQCHGWWASHCGEGLSFLVERRWIRKSSWQPSKCCWSPWRKSCHVSIEKMKGVWRCFYGSFKGIIDTGGDNNYSHHTVNRLKHSKSVRRRGQHNLDVDYITALKKKSARKNRRAIGRSGYRIGLCHLGIWKNQPWTAKYNILLSFQHWFLSIFLTNSSLLKYYNTRCQVSQAKVRGISSRTL